MKKTGQYDIIKIIAIFMILILHYLNKHIGNGLIDTISLNGIITHTLESICINACNLFVLVTAWFMMDKNTIKYKKIIDIVIALLFYGILIYIVCLCAGLIKLDVDSLKTLAKTIGNRWFLVIYIILYLLIPYLNTFLSLLKKKDFSRILMILLFFFSLWPTFFTNITVRDYGYGIINFVLLYSLLFYVKKHTQYQNFKNKWLVLIFIVSIIITVSFSFISDKAWNYNSLFVIVSSIALFLLISKKTVQRGRIKSYLSSFALSTYIIHENEFISKTIYQGIFKTDYYSKTNLLIPNIIISVLLIFVGCFLVEVIRRWIFKYTIDKLLKKSKIYNEKFQLES